MKARVHCSNSEYSNAPEGLHQTDLIPNEKKIEKITLKLGNNTYVGNVDNKCAVELSESDMVLMSFLYGLTCSTERPFALDEMNSVQDDEIYGNTVDWSSTSSEDDSSNREFDAPDESLEAIETISEQFLPEVTSIASRNGGLFCRFTVNNITYVIKFDGKVWSQEVSFKNDEGNIILLLNQNGDNLKVYDEDGNIELDLYPGCAMLQDKAYLKQTVEYLIQFKNGGYYFDMATLLRSGIVSKSFSVSDKTNSNIIHVANNIVNTIKTIRIGTVSEETQEFHAFLSTDADQLTESICHILNSRKEIGFYIR